MDSDEENPLHALLLRQLCHHRRKQQRRLWMHPLTADRLTSGQFYTIMSELKQDSCKFHNYFRMSKNSFDELSSLLKTHIGKADTNMRQSITAEERLAITLSLHKRWTHQSVETQHGFLPLMMQGIHSGTVVDYHQMMSAQMDTGRCSDEFEKRLMDEIRHTRLQEVPCLCSDSAPFEMSHENSSSVAVGPQLKRKTPHYCKMQNINIYHFFYRYLVTGCTFTDLHYIIRCGIFTAQKIVIEHLHDICFPDLTEEEWLKIANCFETRANLTNCLGAIDGKHIRLIHSSDSGSSYFCNKKYFSMLLSTFVDIGSYGKASDSAIYQNSPLFQKLKVNASHIPSDKPIRMGGEPLPFTFVGDEAFALSTHMQWPYGARRYIECSFGILTNKWCVFHRALNINVNDAATLVKACCELHNFVRERDSIDFDCTLN
ncbi:hypothetical protein PR048_033394 [Dryococelus australis]|uniref:DDE Tnp4 domain-containing protein n=1 Tax=Dryococelus australis TaxID=614101 RepID=A0ABQ9G2Z9_9NEOP|nr:hypothetical protein PR048_033394 [Dryococelus australis]